ncbi:MAG: Rho termination factor N-terminal domain-containing protein [Candidatus Delongbacteria bacterium]|jgi:hypothetical protein|nr:Rho termination factor N-terminal domain-containing protein [Candidatus Delongbacteria bacterium]
MDQVMNEAVYNLINTLLQVILVSLIISTPFIIVIILMYGYGRYKKWKDTEIKEKEKIILGRSKAIVKQDEELQRQADDKKRLDLDVELLQKRKKSLTEELGLSDEAHEDAQEVHGDDQEEQPEESPDIESMNIKQLKSLAKEIGLTRYSKKNKKQLVKMLNQHFGK